MILANPPFGTKSSVTIITEGGGIAKQDLTVERDDFWTSTSNKQLMFLQHIVSTLKVTGSAAVVLPDNILFEGGPGEVVRRKLLHDCNLHTILRLPTGLFYAQGVKANVLFFSKGQASSKSQTSRVWYYDLRTNMKFTLKQRPLTMDDLQEFISLYKRDDVSSRIDTWSEENKEGRWRSYSVEEILSRKKVSLDIFWIRNDDVLDFDNLPNPVVIAEEIIDDLEEATSIISNLHSSLNYNENDTES